MVEPVTDSGVKQSRVSSAGGASPLVAPQITIRPPGRSDRTECAQVACPTVSITTSTRSGSRAPVSKAWSAPSLTARSRLASVRLVAPNRPPAAGALDQDGGARLGSGLLEQHPVGRQVGGRQAGGLFE